jgi:hypothetical protein
VIERVAALFSHYSDLSRPLFLAPAPTASTASTPASTTSPFSLPHHLSVCISFIGIQHTIAVAVRSREHRFMALIELFFAHFPVTVQVHTVHAATTLGQHDRCAIGHHRDEGCFTVISDCWMGGERRDDSG